MIVRSDEIDHSRDLSGIVEFLKTESHSKEESYVPILLTLLVRNCNGREFVALLKIIMSNQCLV